MQNQNNIASDSATKQTALIAQLKPLIINNLFKQLSYGEPLAIEATEKPSKLARCFDEVDGITYPHAYSFSKVIDPLLSIDHKQIPHAAFYQQVQAEFITAFKSLYYVDAEELLIHPEFVALFTYSETDNLLLDVIQYYHNKLNKRSFRTEQEKLQQAHDCTIAHFFKSIVLTHIAQANEALTINNQTASSIYVLSMHQQIVEAIKPVIGHFSLVAAAENPLNYAGIYLSHLQHLSTPSYMLLYNIHKSFAGCLNPHNSQMKNIVEQAEEMILSFLRTSNIKPMDKDQIDLKIHKDFITLAASLYFAAENDQSKHSTTTRAIQTNDLVTLHKHYLEQVNKAHSQYQVIDLCKLLQQLISEIDQHPEISCSKSYLLQLIDSTLQRMSKIVTEKAPSKTMVFDERINQTLSFKKAYLTRIILEQIGEKKLSALSAELIEALEQTADEHNTLVENLAKQPIINKHTSWFYQSLDKIGFHKETQTHKSLLKCQILFFGKLVNGHTPKSNCSGHSINNSSTLQAHPYKP